MPPFPVQPEGLVASDGKSVVGIQVCFLDAGHINIFFMKSFSERDLFVEDSLCIPLQNVERSCGFTMIGAFLASRIYPPFPKPGSSHRDHQSLLVGLFEAQDPALHQPGGTPLAEHHHV